MPDARSQLGEIIRRQRELNEMSMREFARAVGISNPYLSQIERGLRAPSEQVLEAIAASLETSAGALYEQAGISRDEEIAEPDLVAAIKGDKGLTARQRQALVQVYEAFVAVNSRKRR